MTFGEALTVAMQERNTNANRVSVSSGVSRSYISKLISGKITDPTWIKACALISALNMQPSDFLAIMESDNA